ncbi:hypothetical protein C1646_765611 [Rhizophagus diaphanus]|nr:hypothetical protein C1646_765611 [Rhizophagus diaphanus] [Rhizophagus sp. MUCL 43196]
MGNEISNARKKLELEYEARKRDTDLRAEESKNNYILEIRKADMEHQHKIAELMAQMRQTKLQSGKELLLSYLEIMNTIIQQNSTVFQSVEPLLKQLQNDKLSDSMKGSIERACDKALNGYMDTQQLLDYSKKQIIELQLKQDDEFERLLGFAVERKVITSDDKLHLLEE